MKVLLEILHRIDLLIDRMAAREISARFDVAVAINLLRYAAYEARRLFEKLKDDGL